MSGDDNRESADAIVRAMELELAQTRAGWAREREKHRTVRMLAFSFLSLVIFGALLALFFLFSRAGEMRGARSSSPQPAQTPAH